MTSFSVVVPVKNGERYLEELLSATIGEGADEILVIDSGSEDRSIQIAARAGVDLLEIEPASFGHGRTRNLGMERTRGERVAFLTQDATPCPGWRSAYEDAFALSADVGAAFGPHLPRPSTSPMIARELTEFFATFTRDGGPTVQRAGDLTFLSNANACYSRLCWEQIRFRDVAYSEDQAFGVDMLDAGWAKVYAPRAAVLHAHDYELAEFLRRYFDEYRGLHATVGHVEPFGLRSALAYTATNVAGDRRWMAEQGLAGPERARWLGRSAAHHLGRRVFSALGSRAGRLPSPAQRMLSLERRDGDTPSTPEVRPSPAEPPPVPLPPATHIAPSLTRQEYQPVVDVWEHGPAPLLEAPPGIADRDRLRIAMVLPPFTRGSGGHNTLLQLLMRLERRGHVCSVWVHDYFNRLDHLWPGVLRHDLREFFAPIEAPVYKGFDGWRGADVVLATGWQTVHAVLNLPNCHARAYVVNDHEPEFFAASTERKIATDSYRHGLHCIAASPWLRDLVTDTYGASADAFTLGVNHDDYKPRPTGRRRDTVIYYARHSTPRRAVPIGLMGLEELYRRRPDVRIVLFGTENPVWSTFPYEHLGVLRTEQLSWLYSQATVGLCLSLTNFSLMPKEMLACGLPCVEAAGISAESIFGPDGPIELAQLDPTHIADGLQRLLEDRQLWEQRSRAGIEFVASHTWDRATDEVEAGVRHALSLREGASEPI